MDPTTQSALQALMSFLPAPYATYAADVVGIAGVASMLASLIAARIKPPSSNSKPWIQTVYSIATWPAMNLGWARNAVVPGMTPAVQQAALAAAKLAAAAPELAVPAVQGAILPPAETIK